MKMTTTLTEKVEIGVSWPRNAEAQLWLIQPPAAGITDSPPYQHGDGADDPYACLQAAIAADAALQPAGPVFFVVPELSIPAAKRTELLALSRALPQHRVLVAGLGHLTAQECDDIERGTSDAGLWRTTWSDRTFANAALIACGGQQWLVAKDWPSKFEQNAGCSIAHRKFRVFEGDGVRFAVVICSEVLPAWNDDAFIAHAASARLDAVFWIQHNPQPRHPDFQRALAAMYERHGDMPMVVAVNKQPEPGQRRHFGASSIYAPARSFGASKDYLGRTSWAAEPLGSSAAARAVLLRYDAHAHHVSTILPSAVAHGSEPGNFLREVAPHHLVGGKLERRDAPVHLHELYAAGRSAAWASSALGALSAPAQAMIEHRRTETEAMFSASANLLHRFLDCALLQKRERRSHSNHQSHTPAAACDCWAHREDFDSLYAGEQASLVNELLLAIAALRTSFPLAIANFGSAGQVENVSIDPNRKLLLASSTHDTKTFLRKYFDSEPGRARTAAPSIIVLQSEHRTRLPANAARVSTPRATNAADSRRPEARVMVGHELWTAVAEDRLQAAVQSLVAP